MVTASVRAAPVASTAGSNATRPAAVRGAIRATPVRARPGFGAAVSGTAVRDARLVGSRARARRERGVTACAAPAARVSASPAPRSSVDASREVSSPRRGARVVARGSLRPRGMTDEQWAAQERQSNPNYRQFTQRAKDRIRERGPMLGDMVGKDDKMRDPGQGKTPRATINLEMMGKHPDSEEPRWDQMPQMQTSVFHQKMRDGRLKTFEVWDPPRRNEKWPPTFFRDPLRARRYVVRCKDDDVVYWVDGVNEDMDRAVRDFADSAATWYTYHQKPESTKFNSWQYLGSAFGGFAFLTGSIYLGIKRKHSIPTDAIQAMEFAQSRADARKDAQVDVTLEDVGGLENIVEDLNEVIAFLKSPEKFRRLGAKPPKGLLMEGGPGVGKTLIAKAIAGEANVPFYSMSGSEFVEIIVGVGAARVRDLFKRARLNAPCLIFVDEIDALGTKRAAAGTRGTEEHEQTLNQLLTEMDGFTPDTGVVFVGATNRADLLDPALMRPGRFDRKVTVPAPGIDARAKILQIHLAKRNVDPSIDTLQFAKNLPGLSGAELANICNEAAAISVRRGGDVIEACDVLEATDRVTNGLRHPSVDKQNEMVHRLTRHELGHALVASVLQRCNGLIEPVERVSIVPRGRDPTQTTYNRKRDEDYLFPTRARLLERVQVLLAGRAAEEVYFGDDATSYGSDDVRDANDLTRNVVVNYALGQPDLVTTYTYDPDTLFTPERHLASRKSSVASTGEVNRHEWNRKIHGYGRAADFDHYQYAERKILQIVNEAMANAKAVIVAHAEAFDAAYEELLANDTLSGERLNEILGRTPARRRFVSHEGAGHAVQAAHLRGRGARERHEGHRRSAREDKTRRGEVLPAGFAGDPSPPRPPRGAPLRQEARGRRAGGLHARAQEAPARAVPRDPARAVVGDRDARELSGGPRLAQKGVQALHQSRGRRAFSGVARRADPRAGGEDERRAVRGDAFRNGRGGGNGAARRRRRDETVEGVRARRINVYARRRAPNRRVRRFDARRASAFTVVQS
jgi:ATP-dependent metalloprotease FtsH